MLNKMIQTYQNAKLAAIKKFSDQNYDILEEPGFLDNGYISMKIESLKEEYTKLDQQIQQLLQFDKKDDYNRQKIAALLAQKDDLHLHIALLASNSLNSLEFAIQLVRNIKTDFSLCLEALYHYKMNRESEAFELFERYFSVHPDPLEHFLINKVYGLLLMKNGKFEKAFRFLRIAAEKRPEDPEVHLYLKQVYEALGNEAQVSVHESILDLLGGSQNDNNLLSK